MQFIENLRLALSALAANKMRALLTMLGIIIGISSVMMITTIGNSIQRTLTRTFSEFGTNYFDVFIEKTDPDSDIPLREDDMISREMVDEMIERFGDRLTPELYKSYGLAHTRTPNGDTLNLVLGGTLMTAEVKTHSRGRAITIRDNKEKRHSAYVTDLFVRQYFKDGTDPIGQTIEIYLENGITADFVIVGLYDIPAFFDKEVYSPDTKEIDKITPVDVPLDTMMALTHTELEAEPVLYIQWNPSYDSKVLEEELRDFFEEKYAQKPGVTFRIENEQTDLGLANTIVNVITVAISVIAAISLVVGGVGVMNIMLVSVTERTKEIGIRKALGAQNKSIRIQFVTEAITICLIGGIIGISLGIAGGMLIGFVAKHLVTSFYPEYVEFIAITIEPSIKAIIISVMFSIIIGVVFGYYPANKAAKMDPIDALRYD